MKRQETLAPSAPAERRRPAAPPPNRERTSVPEYLQEVRGELRKVAWPTKEEVARYSVIVLITVVVLTTFIFLLDYAFAKGVFYLYD
jgi:preprotein translocase subunit SecE